MAGVLATAVYIGRRDKIMEFQPKAGGEPWTATLDPEMHGFNGFDVVLMLDKVAKTDDSGWMLELTVEADGTISGQITAHPGYDALAVFTCSQDTLKLYDDSAEPACVITDAEGCDQMSAARKLEIAIETLRNIYWGRTQGAHDAARTAMERIGVGL